MKNILFCLILLFVFISFRNINAQSTSTPSSLYDGHYSAGVMNIRDFSTPPPGINFVNYNIFTSANKFYDRNGNEITSYTGPTGTTTQLSLDLNGYTNVLVMLYASPKIKSLGGMQYIGGIMPAYTTVSTELASYRIGLIDTIPPESGSINGGVNGFPDFSFMPLCLSWHSDVFVFTTAYKTYVPTGKYSTGGDGNIGLGYWTHQVQVFGFLNPMKVKGKPSKAMAIMLAGTLELNSKIKDVDVTPGSRFSVEYGFSQYLNPKLEAGIMGGSNFQIGEDHGSAVWWDKSVKDQKSYVSFQLAYWIFPQLYASAKYTFNYGLKQRISQNVYQLNLTIPTGWLSGPKKKK